MKIILAIIAASCIVDCTTALSCYQCQDLRFTDPAVAEEFEQGGAPPKCGASDMFACNEDIFVCAAVELSIEARMFGESVAAEIVMRECVLPGTPEEIHCSEAKSVMTSESDEVIDFKSCKVHVCSTDNCNTQGMERFQDDGEREKYVSSETKLTISFLLIQLVSFLAVAFLQV